MKLGIISLFGLDNVNFGNRLQAYALNRYLRDIFPDEEVVSLYFIDWGKKIFTAKPSGLQKMLKKIKKIPGKLQGEGRITLKVAERLKKHNEFSKNNMCIPDHPWTWEELIQSDFDIILVGSDVIWGQSNGEINRRAFLDFEATKQFKRLSYAASFGKDWIPIENINNLKRCLDKFQAISVREKSSIKLLNSIGIEDVKYVCDPSLLLSEDHWRTIEKKTAVTSSNYVFAYLLGRDKKVREKTLHIAKKLHCPIVTVPFATGEYNKQDNTFGDEKIMDCSIEEWLWLIDHAALVVTDSFHGTVFSNIFKKKYIVLERTYYENINNRMIDFLQTIGEEDKLIKSDFMPEIEDMIWDYKKISDRIEKLKAASISYLNNALKIN